MQKKGWGEGTGGKVIKGEEGRKKEGNGEEEGGKGGGGVKYTPFHQFNNLLHFLIVRLPA